MIDSAVETQVSSVVDPVLDPHINGEYLKNNPNWHAEYSPLKASTIFRFLQSRALQPRTICEVGCGAGEVLRQLQLKMPPECEFFGCDIAPAAIEMARKKQNARLRFELADFVAIETPRFDLMLVLEVVDHIEDYLRFLRQIRDRAEWKLFSFSLDVSVQSAIRTGGFSKPRQTFSHLHHFNKEIAVATLRHAGYEIVDTCYGPNHADTVGAKLIKPIRTLSFAINQDLSVRMFGGHGLLVLAR